MSDALDKLGLIVVQGGRDEGLRVADSILDGTAKAPSRRSLAETVAGFTDRDREQVRAVVRAAVDAAIHGILFGLYSEEDVDIVVDGVNVKAESNGLHGDYMTEFGWVGAYSAYPE